MRGQYGVAVVRAKPVDRVTVLSETTEYPDTGLHTWCNTLAPKDGTYSNIETAHDSDSEGEGWLTVAMLQRSLVRRCRNRDRGLVLDLTLQVPR